MAVGGTLNGKIVHRVGSQHMMQIGFVIMTLAGIFMLCGYYFWGINGYVVLIPSLILIFGSALTFSNAFSNAFEDIGHIAGYGGGLYSGIQLAGGAFFSAILSHLSTQNQLPMGFLFMASGLLAFLAFRSIVPRST
jgi:hypothetical protein